MRGAEIQGARRPAPEGVLEQYVEDADRAQRSTCGPIARRSRLLLRNRGLVQYCSLKYPDGLFDIDRRQGLRSPRAKREVAHLALDTARVASVAAGDRSLFENLPQHAVMKCFPAPRGESRGRPEACDGPLAPHAGRTTGPDLGPPSGRPPASAPGWRSEPS